MSDLVTIDEYKEYAKIKSNTEDSRITMLIATLSELIQTYCNRTFTVEEHVDYFDARTNMVALSNFPVDEITSLSISEDGGVEYEPLIENEDFVVDKQVGYVYSRHGKNFLNRYSTPARSLRVEYLAGYEEIPKDLKLAIFDMVTYYRLDQQTPSKSLMGGTVQNAEPYVANSFPPHIRRILDLYRMP